MIRSTRIRVGRNLAGFPLGPGLYTADQRAAVESKVTTALQKFDGELKGKYYSLDSLSDKERKQLIDDHFLFKEGDRFLEACGLNRNCQRTEVFSTTMPKLSLPGSMRRINLESSPCSKVPTSDKYSIDFVLLSKSSRQLPSSPMMIILVSLPPVQLILEQQ